MRCDVFCPGDDGPCVGSPGFESEAVEVRAGDSLFLTAWVRTLPNCTTPNGTPLRLRSS